MSEDTRDGGFIIDADPFIPTGTPATTDQVHKWLVDGTITQELFDSLPPEQRGVDPTDVSPEA